MQRNSVHVSEYFKLPRDAIVEIGREVAIEDCPPPSHRYENTSDARSNLQSVARVYQPISAGRRHMP